MERLTKKHIELLRFIARVDFVQPQHVMARRGISRATAYRQLARLREHGLIRRADELPMLGEAHLATRDGIQLTDLPLHESAPSNYTYSHSLACTDVVTEFEASGIECFTEREILAHQRLTKDNKYLFGLRRSERLSKTHRPDVVVEVSQEGHFVAIEVELAPKNLDRWTDIFGAFEDRVEVDGFLGVLYVTGSTVGQRRLSKLAAGTLLESRFKSVPVGDSGMIPAFRSILIEANRHHARKAA